MGLTEDGGSEKGGLYDIEILLYKFEQSFGVECILSVFAFYQVCLILSISIVYYVLPCGEIKMCTIKTNSWSRDHSTQHSRFPICPQ